jgi:hypothetical protein
VCWISVVGAYRDKKVVDIFVRLLVLTSVEGECVAYLF